MKYLLNILFLLFAISLFAQDAKFTASVNKNKVGLNETFKITFSLNKNGNKFNAPSFKDFFVLSGPNQSSNMQFINGNVSQTISFSYMLKPRAVGKYTIGSASIETDGNKILSNKVSIEVTKSKTTPQANQQQQNKDIYKQIGENLFIKAKVDKTNVYQGEQIVVTYKVYTRVSVVNYAINKIPKLSGFWAQDINLSGQISLHTENIDGVNYNTGVLKKTILFPQKSGKLEIDPLAMECLVRVKTQSRRKSIWDDFFDDPFFGRSKDVKYVAASNPIRINVRSLPEANKPSNFKGAVGKLSMKASLNNTETKANEAVTYKIIISGKGNLKLIEPPELNLSKDVEIYDPEIVDNISATSAGMSGKRTIEYLLIPRYKGEYKIPGISFSYFDLTKKDYVTLSTPEYILKVTEGDEAPGTGITGVGKEDVQFIGKDIRFIKTGKQEFKKKGEYFFGSLTFFILLSFPFLAFAGMIFYKKRYDKLSADTLLLKRRKANKIARKRLLIAKKYLKESKKEAFYEEISRALWGYVSDKFNIQLADLSKDKVKDILVNKKVKEPLIDAVINTLDKCEFARFAPGSDSMEMENVYTSTIKLISELEETI